MNKYQTAINLAVKFHDGQKDLLGEPYITHPMRVAIKLETEPLKILGVLHDTVEDTELTIEDIEQIFGEKVSKKIDLLTHKKEDRYEEYIVKLSEDLDCRRVKTADLMDNISFDRLTRLPDTEETRNKYMKYLKAIKFLNGGLTKAEYLK